MRVQELRIGNYYLDIDDELASMSGYELYQMTVKENTENLGVNEYRPIPLTEEWLLRAKHWEKEGGLWIRRGDEGYINDSLVFDFKNNIGEQCWTYYVHNIIGEKVGCAYIKYIHQWQNLFHGLYQEELKFSENV